MRRHYDWIGGSEADLVNSPYEACTVVKVTTAQVLALNATAVELVAAPGAGKWLEFISAVIWMDYATTAYDGVATGEDLVVKWTNAAGTEVSKQIETTGFIDQASDQVRTVGKVETVLTPAVNAALVLHLLVGEIATGDSPLYVAVKYRVWPSKPVVAV